MPQFNVTLNPNLKPAIANTIRHLFIEGVDGVSIFSRDCGIKSFEIVLHPFREGGYAVALHQGSHKVEVLVRDTVRVVSDSYNQLRVLPRVLATDLLNLAATCSTSTIDGLTNPTMVITLNPHDSKISVKCRGRRQMVKIPDVGLVWFRALPRK